MKYKIIIASALIGSLGMGVTSCNDEFAKTNTNPAVLTSPDVKSLFTKGLTEFMPSEYWAWFYDFAYMLHWGQVAVVDGGNGNRVNLQESAGGTGGQAYRVLKYVREINYQISLMSPDKQASYQYIKAMTNPLLVILGIQDTEMNGSMSWSEAYMARYTNPMILTPKSDTQEELFQQWLTALDESIKILGNPVMYEGKTVTQASLGNQDFIYKGDATKWAKLANSVKLKLALNYLHVDKAKAFKIAEEVANSPVGVLNSLDDNMVYNQGPEWYHSQEEPGKAVASKVLMDFLITNKDPRVRFFFTKNSYNSKVVQGYFDAQAINPKTAPELPSFIKEKVEYTTDATGKKIFKGWKAPGEPWVRYYGTPLQVNAKSDPKWNDYFDPQGKIFKLKLNDKEATYSPVSEMQYEMYEGNRDYTYPDIPGTIVQDKQDYPFYALYFSTAEVNLYLAEFKLLGANLPGSAQDYFTKAIRSSIEGWDKMAKINHIPYYFEKYDDNESLIALQPNEIDVLLEKDAYKLTGNRKEDLEKVYIQEHLHFIFCPADMYASLRRSGVPQYDSKYLPYEYFQDNKAAYPIPRRFAVNEPSQSDQMYKILIDSYQKQGFSIGIDPIKQNSERVWFDKGAPEFGAGPNL